jgi:branched-chain amino acid transport system substrate-binding protein
MQLPARFPIPQQPTQAIQPRAATQQTNRRLTLIIFECLLNPPQSGQMSMKSAPGQWIILEIAEGDFAQGFQVKLRLRRSGQSDMLLATGRLPAAPGLPQLYATWQACYRGLGRDTLIVLPATQVTNVSHLGDCDRAGQALQAGLNDWLNDRSVQRLERKLLQAVPPGPGVRLMIQTADRQLRRLPWHLWDLLEESYPDAEVVLSSEFEAESGPLKGPVKILTIEGNTIGTTAKLPVEAIRQQMPTAKIKPLTQPTAQALQDELWNHPWDILCFVGHSDSHSEDASGVIQLNDSETLSLDQMHEALQYSVRNGLKLAIFCSCNGLGLARKLADLKIPYVVVMREPVPDRIAQSFLQHFLTAFSQGNSIHDAVHQARQRLQDMRHQFPCAAWLPVICQNPAAPDLRYPKPPLPWFQVAAVSAVSLIALWFGHLWIQSESARIQLEKAKAQTELEFQARRSLGERILVKPAPILVKPDPMLVKPAKPSEKELGVIAFQTAHYQEAAAHFALSLKDQRNDPESQIYLNNSLAFGKNPLKVAVSVPIGGKNPEIAQEILRGVAQEQTDLNKADGIGGRPVQVEIANDDNNPDIAKGLAQRFVDDATILAVIGHNVSEASVAAAPIYRQGKLVMVTPTSFSDLPFPGDYMFRMVPGIPLTAKMVVDQMAHSQGNNHAQVAVCADHAADGGTYRKEFKKALEQSEVVEHAHIHRVNIDCDFSASDSNPDKMVKKLQQRKINTVLVVPHVEHIGKAIDFVRAAHGKFELFGTPTFMTTQTTQLGKADIKDFEIAVPWHPENSPDPAFPGQAKQRWGVEPTWRTAMAYDTLKTISVGLQKLPTREGLQTALHDSNFETTGASGMIHFESGDRSLVKNFGTLVKIKAVSGSTYGYDFVPFVPKFKQVNAAGSAALPKTGSNAVPSVAPSPVRK